MPPTAKKNKKTTDSPNEKVAFFNRELSWLAFDRRVLELAQDPNIPLLERLKFLSIVSSNLDEFFEIRVAGLLQQISSGISEVGMDGLGPKEQLRRIHSITGTLVEDQYRCWQEQLLPELKKEGILFLEPEALSKPERVWLEEYFKEQVFPVLTPMAIDPAHPFPQLINKGLNILTWLENPKAKEKKKVMAVIPVPRILPRIIEIEGSPRREVSFIFLSDIIRTFINTLFPGYRIEGSWAFRITRNSDLYVDEEAAETLIKRIEKELNKLGRGHAVRLEIANGVDEALLSQLLKSIDLSEEYVFRIDGPINLMRLMSVSDLIERPDLKYPVFQSYLPPALSGGQPIFETIARSDVLLHHPYDSFNPVVEFLQQAARDPQVFAIKQTLYRTSGDSPIVEALKEASRNGKQVTALVELKARFDERNNIHWARQLEEEGVHVVYGIVGLKTHCKCSLVVRREKDGLRRYVHLGTGNYNPKTARIYTDFSLFTAKDHLTDEVAEVFNSLTGFALSPTFKHLLVAPFNLHTSIQEKILRETRNARAGKPARIIAKINSLIDEETMRNLYHASQAGVKIDLIVRGICGIVPGVKKLSENIRVVSILGRYLEHSRIFYFENATGPQPDLYLGSADWMPRNFFRRIEVCFPIEDPSLRMQLIEEILPSYLKDTTATVLQSNGAYIHQTSCDKRFSVQEFFMEQAKERAKAARAKKQSAGIPAKQRGKIRPKG